MEISVEEKPNAIIALYNHTHDEITRYRDMEWKITAWIVGLIAAIVAVTHLAPIQSGHKSLVQTILGISTLVAAGYGIGHILFAHKNLTWNRRLRRKLDKILKFFDKDFYNNVTILPEHWKDKNVSYWQGLPLLLSWLLLIIASTIYAIYSIIFMKVENANAEVEKMALNEFTTFWMIIAGLYGALIIATFIITWYSNRYVNEVTKGSTWVLKKSEGDKRDLEVGFFQPITRYLTWMMVIDIVVFIIALLVALKSAGIF